MLGWFGVALAVVWIAGLIVAKQLSEESPAWGTAAWILLVLGVGLVVWAVLRRRA